MTKCICRVESTGETIELKMEESATIAMLKMKLRTEMNKKAKKIYSSSSSLTTSTTFTKRNDFTGASTASTMKGMNVRNGERNVSGEQQQNANEPRRIVLGGGVPSSLAGKNTNMTRTNVDSMKEDDFRGFDDDDDDGEYEDLRRDMSRNNQQQQLEKNTTSNKKNENVFLRDLSEFANELVEVVAPKPKDQPIHHDKMGESKSNSTSKSNKNNINELETMGSWEKVDEWQAWGEIGQVQVKHRTTTTTPTAAIQTPNVTINVKKVGERKDRTDEAERDKSLSIEEKDELVVFVVALFRI